jgi:ubiquitin-like protein ATG12
VFVNSAFAPAPEDKFGDLFQCFGKTGTLIVNYSLDEAWG